MGVPRLVIAGLFALLLGVAGFWLLNGRPEQAPRDRPSAAASPAATVSVLASNLEIPWEVAFAPDNRIFVTERPGRVRIIENGQLRATPVLTLDVPRQGEGGLQGLALDPAYAQNRYVYLYASYEQQGELRNRVIRYRFDGSQLAQPQTLVDSIPGNTNHNGGRLAFGPDGKLYLTTGDSEQPSLAQDKKSLAGKILRLNPDGSVPADNPFGTLVWSYGHRNPQGLAWNSAGELYQTEHGPSGDLGLCCRDEVNLITKGSNYGWPLISGNQQRNGLVSPLLASGDTNTWAPAGTAFGSDGRLYFGALRGAHLHVVAVADGKVVSDAELFKGEFGRLRAVVRGPDGDLYVTTSNRDGRGEPREDDDKILRVKLSTSP